MRSMAYINSGSIGINITHSFREGNAVSLQLIGVTTRGSRGVLGIIPMPPETILFLLSSIAIAFFLLL